MSLAESIARLKSGIDRVEQLLRQPPPPEPGSIPAAEAAVLAAGVAELADRVDGLVPPQPAPPPVG